MKYFVVSDVHSFYTILINELNQKGFDEDNDNHKLILCGDAFDRGDETEDLYLFLKRLVSKKRLIYIKGNHEDLLEEALHKARFVGYDYQNGTVNTICGLANSVKKDNYEVISKNDPLYTISMACKSDIIPFLLDNCVRYYETKNYIFVHGFIPIIYDFERNIGSYLKSWRTAGEVSWNESRWLNGMYCNLYLNIKEPNKTIVVGHYHASYGNVRKKYCINKEIPYKNLEFSDKELFRPYYGDGIIGIDACTAYTGFINCLVIDDEELVV